LLATVGKGGAKRANHLFKTFASLLLSRKRVKLQEGQACPSAQADLKNDSLNKPVIAALFFAAARGLRFFSANCWNSFILG
jgi:hypothetical protein